MSRQGSSLDRVCVIGAGVMGAAIAAHFANAGVDCLLLDIPPSDLTQDEKKRGITKKDPEFLNRVARDGLGRVAKLKPAPFFSKRQIKRIEVGNLDEDLSKVSECDWVVEAVIENIEVKRALFERLDKILGVDSRTIVSSNTSGLSIHEMTRNRTKEFCKRFLVTHFFNPARYLHLLEIVRGTETDDAVVQRIIEIGEDVLGKGVVLGKDTPNFIANRIGVFGMMETIRLMEREKYQIEEIDAIFGTATGRPKSAVFRTADLVGLDTFLHVAQTCRENLKEDERHEVFEAPPFIEKMVKKGWLGQKSGQGFYRKVGSEIEVLDYQEMAYRPKQKVRFDSIGVIRHVDDLKQRIKMLMESNDRAADIAWKVTAATCIYAANRVGEIADDITQIDNALKWGFGWELGPFETWDAMGVPGSIERMEKDGFSVPKWVKRMLESGRSSFYGHDEAGGATFWDVAKERDCTIAMPDKFSSLTYVKSKSSNIVKDDVATTLVDLGDGVLACEFHTKMNAIDGDVISGINCALDLCEDGPFDALVLTNEGANFSVGANILLLYMGAQQKSWDQIDEMVKQFQDVGKRLRYSKIPTVAAPFQMTLGGGAEVTLWCNRIRAHAELYMGLVEVGVGLIPGGGGNIEMLARTLVSAIDDPRFPTEPMIRRAFETVAMAKVSTSAVLARELLFLSPSDGITMNRRQLLEASKQEALGMARAGFQPPEERSFRLPGKSAYATFDMVLRSMRDGNFISDHDLLVAQKIAHVMTGGNCTPRNPVAEQYLLDLEREAFLSLCGEEKTLERIAYMLEHNKPLRN